MNSPGIHTVEMKHKLGLLTVKNARSLFINARYQKKIYWLCLDGD